MVVKIDGEIGFVVVVVVVEKLCFFKKFIKISQAQTKHNLNKRDARVELNRARTDEVDERANKGVHERMIFKAFMMENQQL